MKKVATIIQIDYLVMSQSVNSSIAYWHAVSQSVNSNTGDWHVVGQSVNSSTCDWHAVSQPCIFRYKIFLVLQTVKNVKLGKHPPK